MNRSKKAVCLIGCLVMIIVVVSVLLVMREKDEPEAALTLQKINSFQTQMTDDEKIELPAGYSGSGIKVSDSEGVSLTGKQRDITVIKEDLNLFITLYNANNYENTSTLLFLVDDRQPTYEIDGNSGVMRKYQIEMPPLSYVEVPVTLDLASLDLENGVHDIWCLCRNTAIVTIGNEQKEIPAVSAAMNRLILGEGAHWSDSRTFETPDQATTGVMADGLTYLTQIRGVSLPEDKNSLLYIENNPLEAEVELFYRDQSKWQTFLLLDGETIPFSIDSRSILWQAAPNLFLSKKMIVNLPQGKENKSLLLLTLPVGHDALPFLSKEYTMIKK